jgi:ATP-dependent Clp protease protease subunit
MKPINIHTVNKTNAEINLFGYVGEYQPVNWKQFQNDFEDLASTNNELTLRINSNGGGTFDGFAMYDLIRNSNCKVTGIVEGVAASIAGVLFQACDVRLITKNSRVMTHPVKAGCYGEVEAMRSMIELMEQEAAKIHDVFVERTGQKAQTVATWMKPGAEKWFDAAAAVANGLATEIVEPSKNVKIPKNMQNKLEMVINAFNEEESTSTETITIIKMDKVLNVLKAYKVENTLNTDSTDAQVADVVENALKTKDARIKELEDKLKTQNDATVNSAVEAAVKDGRITADQKADWTSTLTNNLESGLKLINGLQPRVDPLKTIKPTNSGSNVTTNVKDRENWTIRDWETKDSDGLLNMLKNDPDKYEQLSNAFYGVK